MNSWIRLNKNIDSDAIVINFVAFNRLQKIYKTKK